MRKFHDIAGVPTYGVSITVRELVNLPSQTVKRIKALRLKRKYASKIIDMWRNHKLSKEREKLELNERETSVMKKSVKKWSRRFSAGCLTDLDKSATEIQKRPYSSASLLNNIEGSVTVDTQKRRNSFTEPLKSSFLKKFPSTKATKLAAESYKKMIRNFEQGDAYIVEQCYILLGTEITNNSLLVSALQNLVNFEDPVSISVIYLSTLILIYCFFAFLPFS